MQTPKKGGAKKTHKEQSTSSQEEEDEDDTIPAHEATAEANLKDADYEPQETVDIHEITQGKKPRRSSRPTKKPTKYGQTETLSTDEDTDEAQTNTPIKGSKVIENFQPGPSARDNSKQGQEDNLRETYPLPGQTQEPAETTGITPGRKPGVRDIGTTTRRRRKRTKPARAIDLNVKQKLHNKLLTNFVIPLRGNVVHEYYAYRQFHFMM